MPPVEEPPLAVSLEPPAEPSEPPPTYPPTPATPALETTPSAALEAEALTAAMAAAAAMREAEPPAAEAPLSAAAAARRAAAPPTSSMTSSFSLFDAALARRGADGESLLVFGGGGGASKTGVPNALVVTRLDASWQMQLVGEHRTGLAPVQSLALSPTADRLACLQGPDVLLYSGVDAPAPPAEPPTWESVATVDKKRPPPPPLYASPAMVLRGPDPDPEADGTRKPRLPEVYSLALSPDGTRIAVGIDDGSLVMMEAAAQGEWRQRRTGRSRARRGWRQPRQPRRRCE